jgi:hypothetical protein
LEGNANEFVSWIMDDAQRARITREPLIFEVHCNMLRSLVVDANDFRNGSSSVDDSECMKAEFTDIRKSDLPRANKVDCDFFPRNRNVITRRKVTIGLARLLVALTDVTGMNESLNVALHVRKIEVSANGCEHTSDAAVSQKNVIPFDGVTNEGWRRNNTPLIVGALKADQVSAIKFLIGEARFVEKGQSGWISLLGLSNVGKVKRKDMNVGWVVEHGFMEAEVKFLVNQDVRIGRTTRKHGITTEKVGFNVEGAWFIKHFRLEVFNKHAPTEDALGTKVRVDQILVIGINTDACAPKHGTEGFKNLKNGEKLFFNSRVPDLSGSQFAAVESQGLTSLLNNSAKLFVGSVGFDVER